jgi:hypothetical protein
VLFLNQRWAALGVVLGLLTLTRPDGFLFLAILVVLAPAPLRRRLGLLLAFAATVAPWFFFSWVALGSLVPDTLLIKLEQLPWEGTTLFATGPLLYFDHFPWATLGSLGALPFLPFALPALGRLDRRGKTASAAIVLYGLIHYAAYAAMGVPPFHWYYVHQVVPIVLVGSLGAAHLLGRLVPPGSAERWAAVGLLPVGIALLAALLLPGLLPRQAPIHTNWATPGQYRAVAGWLRDHLPADATIELRGEIGTLAYFADRPLLDGFSDLGRSNQAIAAVRDRARGAAVADRLLAANFAHRRAAPPFPAPTYLLEFTPTDPIAVSADPEPVMSWDLGSDWMPRSRLSLRLLAPPSP